MSVTLTTVDGRPALEIGDKVYLYALRLSSECWSCLLTQVDGTTYAVEERDGHWRCGCPAARYRPGPCKHERTARELRQLLDAMRGGDGGGLQTCVA